MLANHYLHNKVMAINLLIVAGFLVVLLVTPFCLWYGLSGLLLFAAAAFLIWQIKDESVLRQIALVVVATLITGLTLYSTWEVAPYLDLSLLILIIQTGILTKIAFRITNGKLTLHKTLFFWPMLAYLCGITLSVFGAIHAKDVVYFFALNLGAYTLFVILVQIFRDFKDFPRRLAEFIFASGVVSAVFAVWQLYSDSFKQVVFPYLAVRDQSIMELWEEVSRVVGSWQHPSYLGIYLAIATACGVYLLFWGEYGRRGVYFLSASLVFINAVELLTNTRSSVIASTLGIIFIYLLVHFKGQRFRFRMPTSRSIIFLGVIATCSLILYQFVFVSEIYRKPQAWRVDASATIWGRFLRSDSMSTESIVERGQLYRLAWQSFAANSVTGIGARNFPYRVADTFKVQGTDAHNLILQTLAETGLVGLAGLVALLVAIAAAIMRRIRATARGDDRRVLALGIAVLLVFLFDSFFNNPMYSLRLVIIFWLFLAAMVAEGDKRAYV